jgi:hypothetical protein
VEGAGQDSNRWLREEAGPALTQPPDVLPAELAEALPTVSTNDLLGWVEQARLQAKRPLELEVAVTQSAFDRARSHRAEEELVLQGLQRQLAQVGPWWRPGSRRRRSELKARIAQRQQVLTRLSQQLHQTERRVSELLPTRQAALERWAAQQRRVLDRAAAAVQELQQRERGLPDGHPFDPPERLESASATGLAVDEISPRTGSGDDSPMPTGSPNQQTDTHVQLATSETARDSVGLGLRRRVTSAGVNDGLSIAIVGGYNPRSRVVHLTGVNGPCMAPVDVIGADERRLLFRRTPQGWSRWRCGWQRAACRNGRTAGRTPFRPRTPALPLPGSAPVASRRSARCGAARTWHGTASP